MAEVKGGPGFFRLKAAANYDDMVKRTLAEQQRAVGEIADRRVNWCTHPYCSCVMQSDRVCPKGLDVHPQSRKPAKDKTYPRPRARKK